MGRALFCATVLAAALLAPGCTVRTGDLTIVTNRSVNLDMVDLDSLPMERGVEGDDTVFWFLFIPFGVPTLEGAVDDAFTKAQGDVMTDVATYRSFWWFIVGQQGVHVKGDIVKTRGN